MGTVALHPDYSTAYGTADPFPHVLIDEFNAPALACPDGVTRNSIALHYYAAEPASSRLGRSKLTYYRERPGERFGSLKHKVHQARIRLGGAWRR